MAVPVRADLRGDYERALRIATASHARPAVLAALVRAASLAGHYFDVTVRGQAGDTKVVRNER